MKKAKKVWLIVATSLTSLGLLLFIIAMSCLNWNFVNLSTVEYTTNKHEITETYHSISLTTTTSNVSIVPSDDGQTSVVCYEQEKKAHSVIVQDGVLLIEINGTRNLYDFIALDFHTPTIKISMPAGIYKALTIEGSTGDVNVSKDFTFETIDVSVSTGDVKNNASTTSLLKIKASTGHVYINDVSANAIDVSVSTGKVTINNVNCTGDIIISVSTGQTTLENLTCNNLTSTGSTGDLSLIDVVANNKFTLKRGTGDVDLHRCDAAEIYIKTSTGDVEGSLLSGKMFDVSTDIGDIDIPSSTLGGRCEIITSTGDVTIDVL